MLISARIEGITFESFPRDLDRAFVVSPEGWSGWDEGVPVRRDDTVRPSSHGSFDAPGFLTARVRSIAGNVIASSPGELEHMCLQLTGLLAEGGVGRVTAVSDHGTTWANVRLAGQTAIQEDAGGLEARFQVQFWSPDPRRYGDRRRVGPSASVLAHHLGNFPAAPVLTVAGSSPSGYTVNGPGGRQYVVTRALVAGQPHTIDMSTGWLSVGGVVQVGAVGRAETWAVPPGVRTAMSVTAGTLTVDTLDTFI